PANTVRGGVLLPAAGPVVDADRALLRAVHTGWLPARAGPPAAARQLPRAAADDVGARGLPGPPLAPVVDGRLAAPRPQPVPHGLLQRGLGAVRRKDDA